VKYPSDLVTEEEEVGLFWEWGSKDNETQTVTRERERERWVWIWNILGHR